METLARNFFIFFIFLLVLSTLVAVTGTDLSISSYVEASSPSGEGVSAVYDGESTYVNSFEGAKYKIIAPSDAAYIYIAFEDDYEWQISSENIVEGQIPYILISELASQYPDLFTAPALNPSTQKYESFATLKSNGDLYCKGVFEDESEIEDSVRVNVIDWVGPRILIDTEDYYTDSTSGKYVVNYSVAFSDRHIGLRYSSASSGISDIEIFHIQKDLSEYLINWDKESIDTFEKVRDIVNYTQIKAFENVQDGVPVEFSLSESGYYYYVVMDKVGNITLGFLGKYTQLAPDGFNLPLKPSGYLSVYQYLEEAKNDIKLSEDIIINPDRVVALQKALDTVYYTFLMEEDSEIQRQKYNAFIAEWALFKVACTSPFFNINILNLALFPGNITCINFDISSIQCINGDKVDLNITVTKQVGDVFISDQINSLFQDNGLNVVYLIRYELMVNEEISVPKEPLIFHFTNEARLLNISVVSTVNNINPVVLNPEIGVNYFRLSSRLSTRDIYIFAVELDESFQPIYLGWLWIIMGCLSGLSLIIFTTLIVWNLVNMKHKSKV